MSGAMPTELACLAHQAEADADALLGRVRFLGDVFPVLTGFRPNAECEALAAEMLLTARSLQFALKRINAQADAQASAWRHAYSLCIEMVDGVRVSRGLVACSDLADFCEDKLALLQARISLQFPGEEIPGD